MSVDAALPVAPNPEHPAAYSASVLAEFQRIIDDYAAEHGPPTICDPMCGVGRIHSLRRCRTVGVEKEPEWAACHRLTQQGDCLDLPFDAETFDLIMVSPVYGNRVSDSHTPKDKHKKCDGAGCSACKFSGLSPRKTYKVALGRDPSPGSSTIMQWGAAYRKFHQAAVDEMVRVTRPGGLVVVNMSDHIRDRRMMPVVGWWAYTLADAGLFLERVVPVATPRMRAGQNHAARAAHEMIIVTRKLVEEGAE